MEKKQNPDCWPISKFSLLDSYYAIVDTADYLADQLLISKKARVWFGAEYIRPDSQYCIIFCRCRKRDAKAFEEAEGLSGKMLPYGHTDYIQFREELKYKMEYAKEHEGELPHEKTCPSA